MSIQRAERELAALQRELAQLDARIDEARSRSIKLAHYIEMAREFGEAADAPVARFNADATFSANGTRQRAPQGGMAGRAVQECISILREHRKPMHTKDLSEIIGQRGIHLGGANPLQSLSGYLSRTPGLLADRSVGWSLEEWRSEPMSTTDPDGDAHRSQPDPIFQH
jgi:hypothetical protein